MRGLMATHAAERGSRPEKRTRASRVKSRVNAMIARIISKILITPLPGSAKMHDHRSVCGKRLRRRDAGREMAPAMASAISAQAVMPCTNG